MALTHEFRHSPRINSANNPVWMDGLRILLGLFLFVKGLLFLEHTTDVFYIFSSSQDVISTGKAHFLTSLVHIVGGLMIAFGMLTRLALLCQIPILIGALLIVNPQRGISLENTELIMSLVVMALILFFMIKGPGRYSVDNKVLRPKQSEAAAEA
ncbi:DoxX family protein [Pontibacter sp. BT731]|uniref:DoxX family protein n=1 Tax=Pontibacter coccineus TaxID=3063328 RepID=UPI0026E25786|nr:DoxX family protein [Pontibacter sp. BT731]MDO6388641.1 DoxX family protein [Pontibacter sp. BT731]